VLVKSGYRWEWVFSFSSIVQDANGVREVKGLKYAAVKPKN